MKKPPFKNVYFTGIVRDQLGRRCLSRKFVNPLELIKKYGADGLEWVCFFLHRHK